MAAEGDGDPPRQRAITATTGPGNLLGGERCCGLAALRVLAASVEGLDPALGDEPRTVLAVDVTGGAAVVADAEEPRRSAMDVMLIIDVSYSMQNALDLVQQTCLQVFDALQEGDRISLVSFSQAARVRLPLTCKADVEDFQTVCQGLQAEACTNIEAGLVVGFDALARAEPLEPGSPALVVMLSDGQPTDGLSGDAELLDIATTKAVETARCVTVHSLGFTAQHKVSFMSRLPQASCGPPGSYYYLGVQQDVAAAVGDCLGASAAPRPCRGLQAQFQACALGAGEGEHEVATAWQRYGPAASGSSEDAPLLGLVQEGLKVDALLEGERQVALFVAPTGVSAATLRLQWDSDAGDMALEVQLSWPTLHNASLRDPPTQLEPLAVAAHILRLRTAAALAALAASGDANERFEAVHGAILGCLAALEAVGEEGEEGDEEALFLEGMLQSLERDLGEALSNRTRSPEQMGVLLAFAAEHFAMRSASSLTRVRTAYATRQQIETRLRFLQSTAQNSGGAKAACAIDEPGTTEAERECRQALEQQLCYVTLAPWQECILGVGLFVHARTCRERRGGVPPQVDLVVDYVSAEAYNLGVRTTVEHTAVERAESDDENDEGRPAVLCSSSRRRINAWLPLYINSANWAVASTFAPSAFSLIATQLNAVFKPEDALQVCGRLLCCAVVGFVRSHEPGERRRAGASERAVQMYCDVHRLFLRMAEDYPSIRQMALQRVRDFVQEPEARTRKNTSDLGLLMAYLSIVDEVSWADLRDVFVAESVRRAFMRMKEALDPDHCESEGAIIERFDALEPEHGRVTVFFKVFNELVARPAAGWEEPVKAEGGQPLPVAAVCELYDRRWGQLPVPRRDAVLQEVKRMCSIGSVASVLRELLPYPLDDAAVCELLLWAAKHGATRKAIRQWPALERPERPMLAAWRRRQAAREKLIHQAVALRGLEPAEGLRLLLAEAIRVEGAAEEVEGAVSVGDVVLEPKRSREEACALAAAARERAEKRRAAKGDGKGKGKGGGKGAGEDADEALAESKPRLPEGDVNGRGPFDLEVRLTAKLTQGEAQTITLKGVSYVLEDGSRATGRHLCELVANASGLDARQMKLFTRAWRTRSIGDPDEAKRQLEVYGEVSPAALAVLAEQVAKPKSDCVNLNEDIANWRLEEPGAYVEVERKQRGGKGPGNGWHANHRYGRTYTMCIASAIAREVTFGRVQQCATVVEQGSCLELVFTLCGAYGCDGILLCGGGTAALKHEALGCGLQLDGSAVRGRGRELQFLVEEDAPEPKPHCDTWYWDDADDGEDKEESLPVPMPTKPEAQVLIRRREAAIAEARRMGNEEAHSLRGGSAAKGKGKGKGKAQGMGMGKGKGKKGTGEGKGGAKGDPKEELPTPAVVRAAPEPDKPRVLFVLDGHLLRETASLGSTIRTCSGAHGFPVFHLVTKVRSVLLESEEQLQALKEQLSPARSSEQAVELPGQPPVPRGARLLEPSLPAAEELPALVRFGLRLPSLGLVARLRERFGCAVPEVPQAALKVMLEGPTEEGK